MSRKSTDTPRHLHPLGMVRQRLEFVEESLKFLRIKSLMNYQKEKQCLDQSEKFDA